MKHYLLFVLMGFIGQCSAQQYLDSTSTWYFEGGADDGYSQFSYHHIDYIGGDTAIGHYTYYKLYEDRMDSIIPHNIGNYQPMDSSKHNFVMFLREASQSFYRFSGVIDSDLLLVNFNQHLNDTVRFSNCAEAYAIIRSIDTVYLGSTPRRRFIYDDPNVFLLEGVGTYMGITAGCDGDIGIEGGIYTTCFGQDAHTLSLSLTGGCNIPGFVAGVMPLLKTIQFNVYPNPVSNTATINITPDMLGATMQVTDVTGRVLVAVQLPLTTYQLQTTNLATGVYFLQIAHNGEKVVRELVKE